MRGHLLLSFHSLPSPLPFSSPHFLPLSLPFPFPFSSIRSRPLRCSQRVWGFAVSSPNGVWGEAPAEIEFGAFYPYNMTFDSSNFTNYCARHYSAKRGIELACRPSVRLSVCNVGGSGAHTLEILETNCTDN